MTSVYPNVTSASNGTGSSYQAIIDAFNGVRAANGETYRPYPANYQGIIQAIVDLQKWGHADTGPNPPNWYPIEDSEGNIIGGDFAPYPKNGDLWFDTRQGRLFIWMDDAYYQCNGADGIPAVTASQPTNEVTGALWFNTGNSSIYIYDGTQWLQVTAPTGFSTANLPLSNPTTATFTGSGSILPTTVEVTTQEDYNQWVYNALTSLETGAETSAAPIAQGTTLPSSGEDGEFFYKTDTHTLYVCEHNNFYPATPYPDISNDANITALQTKDSNQDLSISALEQEVDGLTSDVGELQNKPSNTYTLGTSAQQGGGDGFTPGIWLKESKGALSGVNINGAGAIAVAEGQNGITIAAAAIESALAAIEADYVIHTELDDVSDAVAALDQTVASFSATQATLSADVAAIQAGIAALPTAADVTARLSAAGGTLSGILDMGGNALQGLANPLNRGDATSKGFEDDREASMRNDLVAKVGTTLQSVILNNSDLSKAALDFSSHAVNGNNALKFKSFSLGDPKYVTFGTTDKPWEYSWKFDADEAFNYIHNGERVFAVQGSNTYAKDLVLCNLTANAGGPVYTNQISVRTKLDELETATTSLTTQINQLDIDSNTKNIYYADAAPQMNIEDGDIWFDSHNLRLNVRHGGYWVFPDRVEDVALKSALYNAVNASTDYASLKTGLLTALS